MEAVAMATTWTGPEPGASAPAVQALRHTIVAAVLVLLTAWALQFQFEAPPVPLIWLTSAVALAAPWRFGYGLAPTVGLVVMAIHLYRGADPLAAVLVAGATMAGGVLGAGLLRRWRFDGALARVRDVGLLLAVGGGVAAVLSAFAGSLMVAGLDIGFTLTFGLCWVADTMGVLLFAPLLITARRPRGVDAETLGWVIGVPGVVYGIYAGGLPDMTALPASYAVFPLILAVALRRSAAVVTLVVAAIAVIAITCTANGKGPFVQGDMQPNMLALHAHLAMLALTGLLLAAIRSERGRAEQRSREHLRVLARAGRVSAISTMAAGIAHEINQPVCAVQSYAQTARRLVASGRPASELDPVLERIVNGNERVSAIVQRMRGFLARGDAAREVRDLGELVRAAVGLVQPECNRQGVRLVLEPAARALPARVAAVEIEQVVVNLVQNALDALTDGADAGRRWVRLATSRAGSDWVELRVTDGGPGLPAGDPATLFEPLAGGNAGGTGLGLAIARSIIEAHGGTIQAANATGGGAEFRVSLPAAPDRESGREPGTAND
jgi:two-component system NtrC family sensor kinase